MTDRPADITPAATRSGPVGIICVHGIGFQEPKDTLLAWADAMVRPARMRNDGGVVSVDLDHDIPTVTLDVGPQTWIVTEAFWAASIRPPSFERVASWLGAGVLARTAEPVVHRGPSRLLLSASATGVLTGYGFLRSLIAVLPFEGVQRSIVAEIDRALTGWVGDLLVLIDEPAQAAAVRQRVNDAVCYLRREKACSRVVIIAHSGGAAVTYAARRAWGDPSNTAENWADEVITLGQGLVLVQHMAGDNPDWRDDSDATLANPRWVDFHASSDPATVEPIANVGGVQDLESRPILNRASIREDHGAYWDNPEEFVLPVLDEIASAGALRRFRGDVGVEAEEIARRKYRVAILQLWNVLMTLGLLITVLFAATTTGGPSGLERLGDWLGDRLTSLPPAQTAADVAASARAIADTTTGAWASAIGNAIAFGIVVMVLCYVILTVKNGVLLGHTGSYADYKIAYGLLFVPFCLLAVPAVVIGIVLFNQDAGLPISVTPPVRAPLQIVALAIVAGVVVLWLLLRLRKLPVTAALVTAALFVLTVVPLTLLYAALASPPLGRLLLGIGVAWALFEVLRRLGKWRWRAWDLEVRSLLLSRRSPAAKLRNPPALESVALYAAFLGLLFMLISGGPIDRTMPYPLLFVGGSLFAIYVGLTHDAARHVDLYGRPSGSDTGSSQSVTAAVAPDVRGGEGAGPSS